MEMSSPDLQYTGQFPNQWRDTIKSQEELVEMANLLSVGSTMKGTSCCVQQMAMCGHQYLFLYRDDKNLLLFLLRNELQSKVQGLRSCNYLVVNIQKSAGSKAKGAVKKLQEGIEKSFEAVMKYCEEPEYVYCHGNWNLLQFSSSLIGVDTMPSPNSLVTQSQMYVSIVH